MFAGSVSFLIMFSLFSLLVSLKVNFIHLFKELILLLFQYFEFFDFLHLFLLLPSFDFIMLFVF